MKSSFEQFMDWTRKVTEDRQRNMMMASWMERQKAKVNEELLKYPLTRRISRTGRLPTSPFISELGLRQSAIRFPLATKTPLTIKPFQQAKPSATISKVWADYNVEQANQQGMLIHVAFSAFNLLEKTGIVAVYFYFANGMPLKDFNSNYRCQNGNVCVSQSFKPQHIYTAYDDFALFIPYNELHMGPGNHSLKFYVVIWSEQNVEIAYSQWIPFSYTEGSC